jgi:hypothetical protein
LVFRKDNYERHKHYHPEIIGAKGLGEIENALTNPHVITEYALKNKLGQVIKKTEVFYKEIGARNTVGGRSVIDYWKVVIVWNEHERQWEIATGFITSGPRHVMINNRIEKIVYQSK